jgi:hypothetical protein
MVMANFSGNGPLNSMQSAEYDTNVAKAITIHYTSYIAVATCLHKGVAFLTVTKRPLSFSRRICFPLLIIVRLRLLQVCAVDT